LLLVAQTVLLAPAHDLSVANADWLVRSVASAMVWMVMTNTPLGHFLDTCELIVEQNFIGGWLLVDYFSEPVRQFTDILRKLRSEVLEKVMSLRSGGLLYVLGFLLPLTETLSTQCRTKGQTFLSETHLNSRSSSAIRSAH